MSMIGLSWITYIASSVIYMAILYIYFSSVLDMRFSKLKTILLYICIFGSDVLFMYSQNGLINVFLSLIGFAIIFFLYKGNAKTRISMIVFIYMAAFLSDFIAAYSIIIALNISIEQMVFGELEYIYGIVVSRVILAIFANILSNITKTHKHPKISILHCIMLIITPIASIFVINNFLYMRTPSVMDIISCVIILVLNLIVINVYDKILLDYEKDVKNKLLESQIEHYSYQAFLAESSEKIVRETRHDFKNLLVGFKADIRNNNWFQLENRIDDMLGKLDESGGTANSGNIAIDSIINFKANIAKQSNVYISAFLNIPSNLILDSSEICLVLGNALDNAIEATERVDEKVERIIQIDMDYKHDTLFIQIINPFVGDIRIDKDGQPLSTKRGFGSGGIGLQSINNAISDDRGTIDIKYDNTKFYLSIVLFDIKQERGVTLQKEPV